jgi:hypothetical protein
LQRWDWVRMVLGSSLRALRTRAKMCPWGVTQAAALERMSWGYCMVGAPQVQWLMASLVSGRLPSQD